jgi:uncharacterized phage protein (TIGR02220 family)
MIYSIDKLNEKDADFVRQVIEYLNSLSGATFNYAAPINIQYVLERQSEGYTLSDFKIVIQKKCKEWLNTNMKVNLRPITLFSQKNFENYLNAPEIISSATKKSALDSTREAIERAKHFDWGLGEK